MWDAGVVGAGELRPASWVGDAGRQCWHVDGHIQGSFQVAGVAGPGEVGVPAS